MPFNSNEVEPTVHIAGRYYPPEGGLTDKFDAKLSAQVMRALNRLHEGEWDRFGELARGFVERGFAQDVADAKALNEIYGNTDWQHFRK